MGRSVRRPLRQQISEVRSVERPVLSRSPTRSCTADVHDGRQHRWISAADTCFVGRADEAGNVDASRRGGNPRFVDEVASDRLPLPD